MILFCGFDIVIDGYSPDDSQRREIKTKLLTTDFDEYGKLFQTIFPGKIVIYNCDGGYWYYKDGIKVDFPVYRKERK